MEDRAKKNAEAFGKIWQLKEYFNEMDRTIEAFDKTEEKNPTVEELKKKRNELFKTAMEISRTDLQIVYYVHSLEQIRDHQIFNTLKKLFNAQCEFKNAINGTEKFKDPFEGK